MPIYEFTKSELCDLYEYQNNRKGGFVHRFSVATFTDNKANFDHHRNFLDVLTICAFSLFTLRDTCSENVHSGPEHGLPLHPPLNSSHIGG